MGNNSYADIVGIGDVYVETNTEYTLVLKTVQHVPDMRLNLISTHILDKEGYVNYFGDGKMETLQRIIGTFWREDLLYIL